MKKKLLPILTLAAVALSSSAAFAADVLAEKYAEIEKADLDGKTSGYYEVTEEYHHAGEMAFDFKSGAVSGKIADFDGDGADELLVVYAENTDKDDNMYLAMYEENAEKGGAAVMTASSDRITNFLSGEKGGGCVFFKKVDDKDRIFMQYTGEINSYADGADVQIKGFEYDGSKFNTVLDIETGGSAADLPEEDALKFKSAGLEDTFAFFVPDEEKAYHFNPYYDGLNIGKLEKEKEMLTDITVSTNIFDIYDKIDWEKENERIEAAVKDGLITVKVDDKTDIKAGEQSETKIETEPETPAKDPDEIWVYLNGEKMTFDADPYIENGTTRVPMRAIFEGLGAEVGYDGETKTVTAQKDDTKIELVIGSDSALVNGEENKLLVPAEIKNSRTMVPLRFVSEALGANVDWDGETKTITITSL